MCKQTKSLPPLSFQTRYGRLYFSDRCIGQLYRTKTWGRGGKAFHVFVGACYVLHLPHKNDISPIFCTNLRLEAPLPLYFSSTNFRNSAVTPATPLIRKCTTRRWTLRCSHYSVAKGQQFFVPSTDCDIVAELSKCGFGGLDLFSRAISNKLTAVRARTSTSRVFFC